MQSDTIKILVVEDEPYIRDLLARYLGMEGYACRTAPDGETALELLQGDAFHLVITDIMMPGMSGMDLLNIIRTLYPDTAVLMVTSVDDRETGILAIELGAYGYVIKPFERNEILINVANAMERRRSTLSSRERTHKSPPQARMMTQRRAPIKIPAREAVQYIRSGMDDASLLKKFNLSVKALYSLFDQLVGCGYLGQSEIDRRGSLSPGTVVLDVGEIKFPSSDSEKPAISAKDAVKCIRTGLDDSALMTRYQVSAKGLRSLFRKLVAAGVMDQSELDRRMSETHDWAVLEEDS
ncbi:MAG: response regulator [Pseudomonadota bacterium]